MLGVSKPSKHRVRKREEIKTKSRKKNKKSKDQKPVGKHTILNLYNILL